MNTLPSKVHDSKNGLDYTLVGDYYLPDLEIERSQPLGKYSIAALIGQLFYLPSFTGSPVNGSKYSFILICSTVLSSSN